MNHLCVAIQDALHSPNPGEALKHLLDAVECDQTYTKGEVYDALMTFLPTEDEARYDVLLEELDAFLGGCSPTYWRWPREPPIEDSGNKPRKASRACRVAIGVLSSITEIHHTEILPGAPTYLIGLRSGAYADRWEFPGGKLEPADESMEKALAREWDEELGLRIRVGNRLFTGDFNLGPKNFEALAFEVFTAEPWCFALLHITSHSELRWATRQEILALPDDQVTPTLKLIAQELT